MSEGATEDRGASERVRPGSACNGAAAVKKQALTATSSENGAIYVNSEPCVLRRGSV